MLSQIIINSQPDLALQTAYQLRQQLTSTTTPPESDPDFLLISAEPGETIKIEQVRNLAKEIIIKPLKSAHKTIIIHPGNQLTPAAQQALLKTLEEPPDYALIILTSDHPDHIIPTVLSRAIIHHPELTAAETVTDEQCAQLINIISQPAMHRFYPVITNRQIAEDICIQHLKVLHQILRSRVGDLKKTYPPELLKSINQLTIAQLLSAIRLTQKTIKHLQSNANITLALDHFYINLPTIQ